MTSIENFNRKTVLVTGRNYSNILTTTRALGEAGYDVVVLKLYKNKPNKYNLLNKIKCDSYSKYVIKYEELITQNDYKMVAEVLLKFKCDEKILLLPVDDYSVYIIDKYYSSLCEYFWIPNILNQPGKICYYMNKDVQKEYVRKLGMKVIESKLVKIQNNEILIPDNVEYPCFVKPAISMKSNKAIMKKCDNQQELIDLLSKCKLSNAEYLVEKFIDIKNEYSLLGLVTEEKVIAPGFFKVIEGGHKERKGVAIVGEILDPTMYAELIKVSEKIIHDIGYTGIFDFDYIESKEGEIYFTEINFRGGSSLHAVTKMGINLPKMLADYYMKNIQVPPIDKSDNYGKKFINEKVLLEEYVRCDISFKEAKHYIENIDIHFIKDDIDKEPYFHLKKFNIPIFLMKIIYSFKDKF